MRAEYGIDLGSALWGKEAMGARKLLSLIEGLPPDSALHRAINGGWGVTEELLSVLIEVIDLGNRMYMSAHGASPSQPLHIPRPWDEEAPVFEPEPEDRTSSMQKFFAPETVVYKGIDD